MAQLTEQVHARQDAGLAGTVGSDHDIEGPQRHVHLRQRLEAPRTKVGEPPRFLLLVCQLVIELEGREIGFGAPQVVEAASADDRELGRGPIEQIREADKAAVSIVEQRKLAHDFCTDASPQLLTTLAHERSDVGNDCPQGWVIVAHHASRPWANPPVNRPSLHDATQPLGETAAGGHDGRAIGRALPSCSACTRKLIPGDFKPDSVLTVAVACGSSTSR